MQLEPVRVEGLKAACVRRLEERILSGELRVGERLPPERKLAAMLGVSRPVVHAALVELAARGLVTLEPRRGAFVNDFRTHGSIALLNSLLRYSEGRLEAELLHDMNAIRLLIERESAALAATHRTPADLATLNDLYQSECDLPPGDIDARIELDFQFHLAVALASGNRMLPLILNSFKAVYTNLTGRFFRHYTGEGAQQDVLDTHRRLLSHLEESDPEGASRVMEAMLRHGAEMLFAIQTRMDPDHPPHPVESDR